MNAYRNTPPPIVFIRFVKMSISSLNATASLGWFSIETKLKGTESGRHSSVW